MDGLLFSIVKSCDVFRKYGSYDPIIINWIYWTRLYDDFSYPGKIRFLGSYKECQEEYSKLHDEYRKKYERLYQNPICYKNIN